jgi:hypothetical protein
MAGKMMSNKAWAGASKAAKEKFGSTMTDLIKLRDSGDKDAQTKINQSIAAGNESSRAGRVAKVEADVMGDYNKRVDENAKKRIAVANKTLDAVSDAVVDVLEIRNQGMAGLDEMKSASDAKKKKANVGGLEGCIPPSTKTRGSLSTRLRRRSFSIPATLPHSVPFTRTAL